MHGGSGLVCQRYDDGRRDRKYRAAAILGIAGGTIIAVIGGIVAVVRWRKFGSVGIEILATTLALAAQGDVPMFHKILLPVDLSERHDKALESAAALARSSGGEVILLHVIEVIPGLPQQEEPDFYKRLERKARAHLARLAEPLVHSGIACRSEVVMGQRAADTARFAAEQRADLIILTCPVFQPERPLPALGSMTWRISLLASCPVLLVR
jgi:nucleotide-binding universal stress UspA family protein